MGRRDELREVELLDPAQEGVPAASTPTRGRRRAWVVGGVVVVATGLAVTQGVLSARDRSAAARLAAVPGVLRPVDDTLDVVRTLTPPDLAALAGEPFGALEREPDGAQVYHWYDPAGDSWTTRLLGPDGLTEGPHQVVSGSGCATDAAPATAHQVVCLVTDGAMVFSPSGQVEQGVVATSTEVVVLDPADGSVLARWPLGSGTSVAALPDGLAVVAGLTGETAEVTGYDALTGRERWRYEQPTAPGGSADGAFRAGDLVAVSLPDGSLVLLAPDGTVVRDDLHGPGGDGAAWSWTSDPDGDDLTLVSEAPDGSVRSVLVAPDGDPAGDLTVDGRLLPTTVDDGSVPDLLLSADTSLYASDARTGERRWSVDLPSTTTALVVRGRVVVTTPRQVVALDGRSGRVLWRSDALEGLTADALFTDGAHILVALGRTGTGAVPSLAAYDPDSGAEVFRTPLPDGVEGLGSVGRTLVGLDTRTQERVQLG